MTQLELLTTIVIASASGGALLSQYEVIEQQAHETNFLIEKRHQYHIDSYKNGFRKKPSNEVTQ